MNAQWLVRVQTGSIFLFQAKIHKKGYNRRSVSSVQKWRCVCGKSVWCFFWRPVACPPCFAVLQGWRTPDQIWSVSARTSWCSQSALCVWW